MAGCVPAAAQTTGSDRPFHGALFGPRHADTATQRLDVSVMALEAYDDNILATLGGTVDPNQQQVGGYYSMLQPSLDYGWKGRRAQIGITEASAFGYYPQLPKCPEHQPHRRCRNLRRNWTQRSSLLVNQTAAYSPSYLYGLFPTGGEVAPGDAIPGAPNYSVNDVESYSYGTTATLSQGISRRARLRLVGGTYRYTNFVHETAFQRDSVSSGLDGQLSNQHTKNVALQALLSLCVGESGLRCLDKDQRASRRGWSFLLAAAFGHPAGDVQLQSWLLCGGHRRCTRRASVARPSLPCVGRRGI